MIIPTTSNSNKKNPTNSNKSQYFCWNNSNKCTKSHVLTTKTHTSALLLEFVCCCFFVGICWNLLEFVGIYWLYAYLWCFVCVFLIQNMLCRTILFTIICLSLLSISRYIGVDIYTLHWCSLLSHNIKFWVSSVSTHFIFISFHRKRLTNKDFSSL